LASDSKGNLHTQTLECIIVTERSDEGESTCLL